jgi:predicted cobalt transporter CbtA
MLKAAVVAGLIAGAITAGFHTLLIEPLIERAIALEELAGQADGQAAEEPVVDRSTQRWGLVLGFTLLGAVYGLFFGLLAYFFQPLRPITWTPIGYGLFLGILLGWSVAMLPFLKYPANPTGVGETETVWYRQGLYVGFIGLSVLGTALAVGLQHRLQRSVQSAFASRHAWALATLVYVIYIAIVYLAMPANPDPVGMPGEIVWPFRVVSFAGHVLFWAGLGVAFGWLSHDASVPLFQRQELG